MGLKKYVHSVPFNNRSNRGAMTPQPITWEDAQATWASETGSHVEVGLQPASHNWTSLTGKPAAGPSCLLSLLVVCSGRWQVLQCQGVLSTKTLAQTAPNILEFSCLMAPRSPF